MVSANELTSITDFEKIRQKADSRPPVEMRTLSVLNVPISSLSQINSEILFATANNKPPSEIIYDVIKQPSTGTLVLESFKGKHKPILVEIHCEVMLVLQEIN